MKSQERKVMLKEKETWLCIQLWALK